ncbi:MAG: DNA/RNA non-specific endonuclease [Flammeovirgaceae bacterium]|nr:DNA/RNA non-specific endonuclease [Flammeovirgaceae bacterium]
MRTRKKSSKKSTLSFLTTLMGIAILCAAYLYQNSQEGATTVATDAETNKPTVTVKEDKNKPFDYLPTTNRGKIVQHKHFVLSYVEEHEQAEWVAYELTREEVKKKVASRENERFTEDPLVRTGSATFEDYINSGYDRGHLAPAGDMRFSQEAMTECFYMSNVSPQDKEFNKEIWRLLEEQVRAWAVKYERIYVVTGPVLDKKLPKIGRKNKISVPKYFYKVILDYQEPEFKAIAFLMENKNASLPLTRYVVSIDAIEKLTGIDFFPHLPDELENVLEASSESSAWKFERWNFKRKN